MKKSVWVMFFLMFTYNVQAITAAQLESVCSDVRGRADNFCEGYLRGVVEGFMFASPLLPEPMICYPKGGATTEQLRHIFLKYIEKNPKLSAKNSNQIVLEAVVRTFPCINKK